MFLFYSKLDTNHAAKESIGICITVLLTSFVRLLIAEVSNVHLHATS